jgi:hypothetical protein
VLAESNPVKPWHPVLLAEIETQTQHTAELSDQIKALTKRLEGLLKATEKDENDEAVMLAYEDDRDDEQQYEYRKRNRECYKCGMRGHIAAYCYASGGGAFNGYGYDYDYYEDMPYMYYPNQMEPLTFMGNQQQYDQKGNQCETNPSQLSKEAQSFRPRN